MSGPNLLSVILAAIWHDRSEKRAYQKQLAAKHAAKNRQLKAAGCASLEISYEVFYLFGRDQSCMIDYIAGTLDRSSEQWKATIEKLENGVISNDGIQFWGEPYYALLCTYCQKKYGLDYGFIDENEKRKLANTMRTYELHLRQLQREKRINEIGLTAYLAETYPPK